MLPQSPLFKQKKSKFIDDDDSIIRIHHIFMKEYGWIPLEEFKKLPLTTLWNLIRCIKIDKEEEEKAYKKTKRKR